MTLSFILLLNSEDMPQTAIDESLYLTAERFGATPGVSGIEKDTLRIGIEDSKLGLYLDCT